MHSQSERILTDLAAIQGGPCVSIYMQTSHGKNGCDENILRFKNLKKMALSSLEKGYDEAILAKFSKKMDVFERDALFWNQQLNGVAFFFSEGFERVIQLHRGIQQLVIVADRFHLKPLIRLYQSLDQFLVLALTANHSRIFRGDRDGFELEALDRLNFSADDFFGIPDRDRHLVAMSISGNSGLSAKSRSVFHNYDDLESKRRVAFLRYCSAIDDVICKDYLDDPNIPVILAALPEHQGVYRSQSRIPRLLDKGININPDAIGLDVLRRQAWSLIAPLYEMMADQLSNEYINSELAGKGSDNIHDIARALSHGRVGKLLLEQDRTIPGRVILDSGTILFADINNPHVNDLLDDFAEIVRHTSGHVVVLPPSKMPTKRGVAAIYRY